MRIDANPEWTTVPQSDPVLTLRTGHANRVHNGRATTIVLHTGAFPWASSLQAGSTFTVAAPGAYGARTAVQVARVCTHEGLQSIPDCEAGHDPEAVAPGRTGWVRNLKDALALARSATPSTVEHADTWLVVDLAVVADTSAAT